MTTTETKALPGPREIPEFLASVVRVLVLEQDFTYVSKGNRKHPQLIGPNGKRMTLPTTLFDGPVRHVYYSRFRNLGADLSFLRDGTVRPRREAAGMAATQEWEDLDSPWTEAEWRELQRQSDVWWRRELAGPEPEPEPEPAPPAPAPKPQVSRAGRELLARLDHHANRGPRDDAQGTGRYSLAAARQMLRDGYSLAHVTRATGWGRMWLEDLAQRIEQGG